MKSKGTISIGRVSSGGMDSYISIEITEESSGIRFVEAQMSLEDFARIVTGLSRMDCDLDIRGLHLVGKKRETKTELVEAPERDGYKSPTDEQVAAALAPYEVDGWVARKGDITNHHNRDRDTGKYSVVFIRHVEVTND